MEKSGITLGASSLLLSEGERAARCPPYTLNPTVIEPTEAPKAVEQKSWTQCV